MLDIKLIREQPELVRQAMRRKKCDPQILEELLDVEAKRRILKQSLEEKLAKQNRFNGEVGALSVSEKNAKQLEMRTLSDQVRGDKARLTAYDLTYLKLIRQIPNLPAPEVPEGESDQDNVLVRQVGQKPEFAFTPQDHETLALGLDLLDMERGVKVSGAKFYYLKNELVILELAVLRFAMDILKSKGFVPLSVPNLVRAEAMYGVGHFASPDDETGGDAYQLERDGLFLAGTAEVGLINFHAGEILAEADLPLRYVAISPAYRRESGTYGKETRGLYRVHQFNKIEMVSLARPEDSEKEHAFLLSLAEDLLQKLSLPYQLVLNCGGDLGLPQSKKWDLETWLPGMNKYGETHSCSNDTDYQARSLNIRFRRSGGGKEKEIEFVHTLNNTGLASPRILIAILENYQQADGSVNIPEVLIPYTGFSSMHRC
jgi:seryl-tRNA synthetase